MSTPAQTAPLGHRRFSFTVGEEDAGLRLDQCVARRVPELSRRAARLAIELGGLFVDRTRVKVLGRAVKPGQRIDVYVGGALAHATPRLGRAAREQDDARLPSYGILYEDEELVAVDKPAGLLTAPTPESERGNLADLLARHAGGPGRIWVVHRLDLETSGVLVFAKSVRANRALAELFRRHDVLREYLAVVAGRLPEEITRIARPVHGRSAATQVEVVRRLGDEATLVRLRLETGRTHQVRIHLSEVGHPVLGDRHRPTRSRFRPPRLALHAARLVLRHPVRGDDLQLESPWPPDLAAWLAGLDLIVS